MSNSVPLLSSPAQTHSRATCHRNTAAVTCDGDASAQLEPPKQSSAFELQAVKCEGEKNTSASQDRSSPAT